MSPVRCNGADPCNYCVPSRYVLSTFLERMDWPNRLACGLTVGAEGGEKPGRERGGTHSGRHYGSGCEVLRSQK